MADSDDEEEEEDAPVVELGEGSEVEGAPLARVASRQTWGMEKSRLTEREADTEIRTPDGPQRLGEVLESVDSVYFARRQDFVDAIENVVGTGPVPTVSDEYATSNSEDPEEPEAGADDPDDTETAAGDADTDSKTDSDPDSEFEFDPDSNDDAEARAMEQGEVHAESSSESGEDTTTDDGDNGDDDAASVGESDEANDTDDADAEE